MIRVLHINCNYVTSNLHQTMIEHYNSKVNNVVAVPVSYNSHFLSAHENVEVIGCFNKLDRVFFINKSHKTYRSILKRIDVSRIDIIHAHTLFSDGYIAYQLKRDYNIPYIVAIRGTDLNYFLKYRKYLKGIGEKILINASKIIFLSKAFQDQMLKNYSSPEINSIIYNRGEILANGIDDFWHKNEYFRTKEIKSRTVKLVYAGKIDKNKNIHTTVEAIRILRTNGWEVSFTVIGSVVDRNEYDELLNEKGVRYVEQQDKENLINYYRENDIFVMPSKSETFGLVYAEALSQGLPIIYSKGQGFDGRFVDGKVGYSVSSSSPSEIAEAISKIVDNYSTMSESATYCSREFDWFAIDEEYTKIYEAIINR